MDNKLKERFKQIDIENTVFGIFIILLLLAYYANNKEKDYFLSGNEISKQEYYHILVFIFLVTVIISAYYCYESYQELVSLQYEQNYKIKEYAYLSFTASLFALLAGIILLYIAINDTEIDAEISL